MKYMLDTNVLIHLIRNNQGKVRERLSQENISDVCMSSITYAELEYGVSKSQARERNEIALQTVISGINVLPFGEMALLETLMVVKFLLSYSPGNASRRRTGSGKTAARSILRIIGVTSSLRFPKRIRHDGCPAPDH